MPQEDEREAEAVEALHKDDEVVVDAGRDLAMAVLPRDQLAAVGMSCLTRGPYFVWEFGPEKSAVDVPLFDIHVPNRSQDELRPAEMRVDPNGRHKGSHRKIASRCIVEVDGLAGCYSQCLDTRLVDNSSR